MAPYSSILAWRIQRTGAWLATFNGVTESQTRLKQLSTHVKLVEEMQPTTSHLLQRRLANPMVRNRAVVPRTQSLPTEREKATNPRVNQKRIRKHTPAEKMLEDKKVTWEMVTKPQRCRQRAVLWTRAGQVPARDGSLEPWAAFGQGTPTVQTLWNTT